MQGHNAVGNGGADLAAMSRVRISLLSCSCFHFSGTSVRPWEMGFWQSVGRATAYPDLTPSYDVGPECGGRQGDGIAFFCCKDFSGIEFYGNFTSAK